VAGARLELPRNMFHEVLGLVKRNQIDGRAARNRPPVNRAPRHHGMARARSTSRSRTSWNIFRGSFEARTGSKLQPVLCQIVDGAG